ncbi:MAG: sterol desaturase family protein [Polyangiaceae bacterium]
MYPDPTLYAVPLFLALLLGERALLSRWKKRGRDVIGYEKRDTWASLGLGIGSVFVVTVINLGVFWLATWLYGHRLIDLGDGGLAWTVALLGWDFSFYWHHRLEHEHRILWACHVSHHSSEHYNLSTALRQPWTPFTMLLLFPPWALLGVQPWMIMVSGGLNLIYQFWIHTEAVRTLPSLIEAVFNTPSHHRVHHGANPEYLDKNYGGILIVWDRLFGTFAKEEARVRFGLTKNIARFDVLYIAFHGYGEVLRAAAREPTLRGKWRVLWQNPAEANS